MKTIKRESIDVGTALSSASKRKQSASGVLPKDDYLADLPVEPQTLVEEPQVIVEEPQVVIEKPFAHRTRLKARIKRTLRFIAKQVYRCLKPLVKPIAFRTRQYFLAGFNDFAQQQHASTHALLSKLEALEHRIASIAATQRLTAQQIEQITCAQQEVPADLLQQFKRIEEFTSAQLGATGDLLRQINRIEELTSAQLASPGEPLQQINKTEELTSAQLVVPEDLLQQINRIESYTCASARRVAVNCGTDEIMIRSEIGYVLCSASDHALIAILLEAGELEPGTRLLIQRLIKPGDAYIDVGANIGMHMLAAAQAMQGSGKIIGFEPFGPTKALIDKTMWINGFSEITETHQLAVSNMSGSQSLNLGATSGHHSLFKLNTPASLAKPPVQVDLTSLDDIVSPDQVIHLLKIDAEGAELDVIEGATQLLKNNPQIKLIVELGLSHLERTDHTVEDWLETFTKLGFEYQIINPSSGELEAYSIEKLRAVGSVNLFFSKAKTADLLETKHED
ncbi:FkbM family methyltransferase [Pseudomonas sp. NPDC087336]|uniref:FkbM family methyltransferase n=1 Tax=Pseudomonas sp. NPDC087336 TaxID=3364436 RepID=UPI00381AD641